MTMTAIRNSYNGKKLDFVTTDPGLDWNKYPLTISSDLLSTISSKVFTVMENSWKSPSESAGIKNRVIVPIINIIDTEFIKAKNQYKLDLRIAENKDRAKILEFEDKYAVRNYNSYRGPAYWCLEWCGYRSKEFLEANTSAHRVKWLFDVSTKLPYTEDTRFDRS
jgi:hypothetical protein